MATGGTLPLHHHLSLVRAWLWLAVLSVAIGAGVAYAVATRTPPTYASQTSLVVVPPVIAGEIGLDDILAGQALAETYADLAVTRPILERAIDSTNASTAPAQLADAMTASVTADSTVLTLTVSDGDPAQASALANAIASELVEYPIAGPSGRGGMFPLRVVDPAVPSPTPTSPRIVYNTALGGAIGLFSALCLVSLVENYRQERREPPDEP
jgi:capsular polysaccharide biosynthesis protein